jgi:iron complex outermembrane recepter protein
MKVRRYPYLWMIALGFGACTRVLAQLSDDTADDPLSQLSRMSLEELSSAEVFSVSKSAQSLSSAPASIYVITREDILRSGVLSIPEALRLAPNMQVTQLTSSSYSNGARGLGGAPDVQNFSNKVLLLIDGRSVYSPLFSGVEYDMQDVLMDDVERIEIISGPGATLWGANAMNGVINIITRRAVDSAGGLLRVDGGSGERDVAARYGGTVGAGAFRVYGKWLDREETEFDDGSGAQDDWRRFQAGFRVDLGNDRNSYTVQGDYQGLDQEFLGSNGVSSHGANLLGRWENTGARIDTRTQVYFDRVDRNKPPEGIAFDINTYDIELQQSAQVGARHHLVWGLGRRYYDYETDNNALAFVPDHRTLAFTNAFLLDTITLADRWKLAVGVKIEDNSYSDVSVLPDLRLSYAPNAHTLFWLAGSRAIRAPTPFDTDVQEFVGGDLIVLGNPDFRTEKLDAYELGFRGQVHGSLSLSASVFYNQYDDLRTIETTPLTLLPLRWGNLMEGSTYGVEAWANIQITPWWRVSPGLRSLHKHLKFSAGASQLVGLSQAGNDPSTRYLLKSSMVFQRVNIEAVLRRVGALPEPATESYTELQARFAWRVSDELELAVKGFNLLNETHREYAAPQGREIRRSVLAELRYEF